MNGFMQFIKKARFVMLAACALCLVIQPALSKMPEIKITNARMVQMPHFRFILPNSAIELAVHQQVSSTTFDIASQYDILDSFFQIGFDLRYNFAPYFAGSGLGDTINFEQNFGPKKYFQRTHSITPYFGYYLGRFTEVKTAVSIGNTLTASVDKFVQIDEGKVIIESAGIKYDTIEPLDPVPNGTMLSCMFHTSFRGLASDYDYTKAEVEIENTFIPLKKVCYLYLPMNTWYLETDLKFYFPMSTQRRPISDVYSAGGYEIMRGYGYREFYGDTLMYAKLNYHIPIVRNVQKKSLRAALQILTIDIAGETARIGNAAEFGSRSYDMKSSVSYGMGCDVVLFDHYNIKFDAFTGIALEPRTPVLYFILTAYSYFSI